MAPTVLELLSECEERLCGVDSPRLSAEVLAAHVLGCSRLDLILDRARELSDSEVERIMAFVGRRERGEPLAYVVGSREFYGLDFIVNPNVLIPRPETEHIVEEVERLFAKNDAFHFADLGTGSGILAVTLTHMFTNATGVAVDICPGALDVARKNASLHGVDSRIEFVEGDFTASLFDEGVFDLVVSNPPYVTESEMVEASREVTAFEPEGALVSGEDGLGHIRAMLPHVLRMLKPGALFFVEIGWQQGTAVKIIVANEFPEFGGVSIISDLAGHDRVVQMRKL